MNEQYIEEYYANNAKKLRKIVDQIIVTKHIITNDLEHFYSLANVVFAHDVMPNYDESKGCFKGWLYSCLEKKILSEVTKENRLKRQADKKSISIDTPIGEEGNVTIGDTIPSDFNIEKEVFTEKEDKIEKYLGKLSKVQRMIVELLAGGYKPMEIKEILHISNKQYSDHIKAIQSYENISVLM